VLRHVPAEIHTLDVSRDEDVRPNGHSA
jgi:hypothetical protein